MKKSLAMNIIGIVFAVFMLAVSIIDVDEIQYDTVQDYDKILEHVAVMGKEPHSVIHKQATENVINYITDELEEMGVVYDENAENLTAPTYTFQEGINSYDKFSEPYNLKNIIIHIPANSQNKSDEALLYMMHHDSVMQGGGASDDILAVGTSLETIRQLLAERATTEFTNDIVFLFTDGEEMGLLGADIFEESFEGYNNLVSRTKLCVNLESRGTSGSYIMFETAKNNYATVEMFSKINENIFTSSLANMIYQAMPNGTDFSEVKDIMQGLNFANLGNGSNYHTQDDSIDSMADTYTTQQAKIVWDILIGTKDINLSELNSASEDAVFFSYLNIATPYYNFSIATIIGVIVLIMLVISIVMNIIYKNFSVKNILKSLIVLFASIILSALLVFGAYYLFSYTAALLGVIAFEAIGSITYSSTVLIICIMAFAMACSLVSVHFGKKYLKITADEINMSVAYFYALLGIATSFLLIQASYIFAISALILMGIQLAKQITLKFMNKDISSLNLELVAFGLISPLLIPIIFLACIALGMNLAYVFGIVSAIYLMVAVPNISKFNMPVFLSKKSDKNNVKAISLPLACTLFTLALLTAFAATSKGDFNRNYSKNNGIDSNDAIVYVQKLDANNSPIAAHYQISDINAAPYFMKEIDGFSYNELSKTYVREVENSLLSDFSIEAKGEYVFEKQDDGSVSLEINKNVEDSIIYIDFHFGDNEVVNAQMILQDGTQYELVLDEEQRSEIRTDNSKLIFTGRDNSALSDDFAITIYEYSVNNENLKGKDIYAAFENSLVLDKANYIIAFKYDFAMPA